MVDIDHIINDLAHMVGYAYSKGYHELGYEPVKYAQAALKAAEARMRENKRALKIGIGYCELPEEAAFAEEIERE